MRYVVSKGEKRASYFILDTKTGDETFPPKDKQARLWCLKECKRLNELEVDE